MYLKRNVFFIKIFVKIDHEIFVKLADADIGYQYNGQSENVWQFNVIIHLKKKKRLEKLSENCTKIHMKFQQTFCFNILFVCRFWSYRNPSCTGVCGILWSEWTTSYDIKNCQWKFQILCWGSNIGALSQGLRIDSFISWMHGIVYSLISNKMDKFGFTEFHIYRGSQWKREVKCHRLHAVCFWFPGQQDPIQEDKCVNSRQWEPQEPGLLYCGSTLPKDHWYRGKYSILDQYCR